MSSVEPPPMSKTRAGHRRRVPSAHDTSGDRQPCFFAGVDDVEHDARLAVDAVDELGPVGRLPAGFASRPRATGGRSVASPACRRRRSAHRCARSIAASLSRPLADNPSPRRTMRENASTMTKASPLDRRGRRDQQNGNCWCRGPARRYCVKLASLGVDPCHRVAGPSNGRPRHRASRDLPCLTGSSRSLRRETAVQHLPSTPSGARQKRQRGATRHVDFERPHRLERRSPQCCPVV